MENQKTSSDSTNLQNQNLYEEITKILETARNQVVTTVNTAMVQAYFEIGKRIVQYEQSGKQRAEYGKSILKNLSEKLSSQYGKGFSVDNLQNMRIFYQTYAKYETVSRKSSMSAPCFGLSWSHYLFLMRIPNEDERAFYEKESQNSHWSLRELKRQFNSSLYERLALSKDKDEIRALSQHGLVLENPRDIVKDPYVLEFLGLQEEKKYSESMLEQKIIDKLEIFLLELGKGYTFVGRQVRFTFDEKHFYVDLVFFNRILQCFVLIDLKIGEVTHQDLGQMQMYVHYYDRFVRLPHENRTIGIILCKKKDDALVEITLPEDNEQIFASKYQMVLPDKKTLIQLMNEK